MAAFKPKPTSVELARAIERSMPEIPATTHAAAPAKPAIDTRTVQINFRGSVALAKAIAEAAEPHGGMRRFIAHLMKQAGYEVPEIDLAPPSTRRKYD